MWLDIGEKFFIWLLTSYSVPQNKLQAPQELNVEREGGRERTHGRKKGEFLMHVDAHLLSE